MDLGGDPVLVVGAQRSGTTALAQALAAASAATGGTFTVNGRLPYLLRRWLSEHDLHDRHLRVDEIAHALDRRSPGDGSGAWRRRVTLALAASADRAAEGVAAGAVQEVRHICAESYLPGSGVFWGDKYNEYLLDLEWLDQVFPRARWVFLIREPSAVIASMLRWQGKPWNPHSAAACAEKWASWNQHWLDFRGRVAPARIAELEFGALCEGDHDALSRLVGLDVGPHLVRYRAPVAETLRTPVPEAALRFWHAFVPAGAGIARL